MSIHMTASFQVQAGSVARCKEAIGEFVTHVRRHEPGTRLYLSLQDAEDPTRFLHVMWFESESAREHHRGSDAVHKFTEVLYPETVDGVTFTEYSTVASNRP